MIKSRIRGLPINASDRKANMKMLQEAGKVSKIGWSASFPGVNGVEVVITTPTKESLIELFKVMGKPLDLSKCCEVMIFPKWAIEERLIEKIGIGGCPIYGCDIALCPQTTCINCEHL